MRLRRGFDWRLLEELWRSIAVPLALHGASGLDDDVVRKAGAGGIGKVNVNTALRERYYGATVVGALPELGGELRRRELHAAQADAVRLAVEEKLRLLGG